LSQHFVFFIFKWSCQSKIKHNTLGSRYPAKGSAG